MLVKLIQGDEQRGRGHDARRRPRAHRRREHGFEPVLLLSLRLQHLQQVRRNDRNRGQLERQRHGFDSGSSNVERSRQNVADCRRRRRRKRRRQEGDTSDDVGLGQLRRVERRAHPEDDLAGHRDEADERVHRQRQRQQQ